MNSIRSGNKKNIPLIYIYTFLSTFILFYACDTLFYLERGVSSSGYVLFVAIIFFVQMILEIPAGTFADKYSKKKILLLSNLLFVISIIIFILSKNYFMFVVATIIKGIDNSLATGIANSILYETLEDKTEFNKSLFMKSFYYNISYMLAMILGGYIGQKYGLVQTYYLTLIPAIINFIIIFNLQNEDRIVKETNNITRIEIFKNALKEIKGKTIVLNSIITSSIMFSIMKLVEESHPDYSSKVGISIFEIGIYTAFILVFCIIGSYLGSKIKNKYHNLVIIINSLFVGVCVLMIGVMNNKIGIIFLLSIYIFSESFENIILTKIHSSISSKSRVTVESIMSMILCSCGIVFGITMSVLLNFIEVYQSYILLGSIIIIYSIFNIFSNIKLLKNNGSINQTQG